MKHQDLGGTPSAQLAKSHSKPASCSDCGTELKTVNYTIWGTKRYSVKSKSYVEDDSPGNTDMEFTCPNCSAKLDPDGLMC